MQITLFKIRTKNCRYQLQIQTGQAIKIPDSKVMDLTNLAMMISGSLSYETATSSKVGASFLQCPHHGE